MKHRLGRRALLAGLGAAGGAAAFLKPILAQTQTGKAPQRLLLIHRPCGSVMNPEQQPGAPSYWWPTSGTPGDTNWVVAPDGLIDSFKDVRDSLVIMKGVHCPRVESWAGDKHGGGMVAMVSPPPEDGWLVLPGREGEAASQSEGKWFTASDRSIDQWLLANLPTLRSPFELESPTLAPDLISAQVDDFCLRVVSYKKDDQNARLPTQITPKADPAVAFQDLFSTAMGGDGASADLIKAQDKSVIDFINRDINSLRPRLPKLAQDKMDVHLASIRQLELQLGAPGSGRQCTPPMLQPIDSTIPGGTAGDGSTDARNDARYHQAALQQFQIIKTAFQCDLVRVANFTFGWGNSGVVFKNVLPQLFPNLEIDNGQGYHGVSHNQGSNPVEAQWWIDKYFCTMTANLLRELAATPDGLDGSSLLDNTLVVFWNEVSWGDPHDTANMPVLLFGGKFLGLKGGHYFDFSDKSGGSGRYMSDFWVQLSKRWANAEGVAGSGYAPLSKYGADRWNLGDMAELFG